MDIVRNLDLKCVKDGPIRLPSDPVSIRETKESITAMDFEPCGHHLAVATFDGHVHFYSPFTGRMSATLNNHQIHGTEERITLTSVKWKPAWNGEERVSSSWVTAIASNGSIVKYNMSTGDHTKDLIVDKSQQKAGNHPTCCDYNRSGSKLVVGGQDRHLYVYNDDTMQLETTISDRHFEMSGHQNRIFGIRCHPELDYLFSSAGWDGSVKLYDLR